MLNGISLLKNKYSILIMVEVLDIPFFDLGLKEAVHHVITISNMQTGRSNRCISATGAHGLVIAKKDPGFAQLLKDFYINLPDGRPTSIIGKLKGAKQMEQCTGPDFFRSVIEESAPYEIKHFFCGGKEGVCEKLELSCQKKFFNKNITGIFSPPFRLMTDEEMKALGDEINSKNIDIVWIGLSTPKQEYFAKRLSQYINVHFIVTVGAAFDFHSGSISKAPLFITKMSMEWFYRLCLEPRRLWKRYLEVVPKFIYYNIVELITKIS
jgi:N-acetylglucosaminyldiphosphoundecaprenol N-acetyl-beta-D-mannosaminyltransferase